MFPFNTYSRLTQFILIIDPYCTYISPDFLISVGGMVVHVANMGYIEYFFNN